MEFTHIANPVRVKAWEIKKIASEMMSDGTYDTEVAGDRVFCLTKEQVVHYKPAPGDYIVQSEDAPILILSREIFERKYREIGAQMDDAKVSGESAGSGGLGRDQELRSVAMNYASRHYDDGSEKVVKAAEAYYQFLKGAA